MKNLCVSFKLGNWTLFGHITLKVPFIFKIFPKNLK